MEVLIETKIAGITTFLLTDPAMDLINFTIQFLTGLGALFAGLLILLIAILIAK